MEIEEAKRLAVMSYWTAAEGRRALELLGASGLGVRTFSARTGISRNRLQYWRSRCDDDGSAGAVERRLEFREVVAAREPRRADGWVAELASDGAWRVRVASDFDASSLARLLSVLESRC